MSTPKAKRHRLILQLPVHPGSLQSAVAVIAGESANINRIQYDRRIDPQTVFFEITCSKEAFCRICSALDEIGYLLPRLDPVASAELTVRLPHEPGALHSLLKVTTESSALITHISFDDAGSVPDTVIIHLDIKEANRVAALADALSRLFHLEEIRFDGLGDTSFYVEFARKLIPYIPNRENGAVVDLICEINRAAQDLMRLGEDPKSVFGNVAEAAQTIAQTLGAGFYADIRTKRLSDLVLVVSIEPPTGGNVYLFSAGDEVTILDTGYGAYHEDMMRLFEAMGLEMKTALSRLLLSHGDADHCGGAGLFEVKVLMHRAALETIRSENRASGSPRETMILETVYSKMIGAFSKFCPPKAENTILFGNGAGRKRGPFDILSEIEIGDLCFEILDSYGGHQAGEIFLFCKERGYLFTADSLIPISALSEERSRYNRIADSLMTSVNVDPSTAKRERQALMDLARSFRVEKGDTGDEGRCFIFPGHGPICTEKDGALQVEETPHIRYTHGAPSTIRALIR